MNMPFLITTQLLSCRMDVIGHSVFHEIMKLAENVNECLWMVYSEENVNF